MTTATQEPQLAMDEEPLEDPSILEALESWQQADEALEAAKEGVRNAEKSLQSLVSRKELDEGTYRSGRFVVRISNVASHQRVRPKLAKTSSKK